MLRRIIETAALAALVMLAVACGGGGASSSSPATTSAGAGKSSPSATSSADAVKASVVSWWQRVQPDVTALSQNLATATGPVQIQNSTAVPLPAGTGANIAKEAKALLAVPIPLADHQARWQAALSDLKNFGDTLQTSHGMVVWDMTSQNNFYAVLADVQSLTGLAVPTPAPSSS
jgi:hypothetical protein